MFKFKKIFAFFIFFILIPLKVSAESKIVFFDIELILSKTNVGKNVFESLQLNENNKNEEFKLEEKKLKEEENKIIASKNIITEEQLKINISSFQKKIENYKKFKSKEIDKLKKTRSEEISKILNQINPIIEEYMTKNSISIILDKNNVYIADRKYDITDILIEIINKSIK